MLKTIRKHGITLALFAAGSTGLTAAINQMTKTTIAEQASLQQKALFDQVLPAERYNNALAQSCYLVTAPELGKGEHRVYIAKQDDKPQSRRSGSNRARWLFRCDSAAGGSRF